MGKKARRVTKAKTNTSKKFENAKFKTHERKRETFIRKFQEAVKSYNDTYNSSNFDYAPQSNVSTSSRRDSTFTQIDTNNRHEDIVRNNFKCYRCEHFSEIPPNSPQPFCKRVPVVIGQCKARVSFIDAIIMLKSATAYASQVPIDKLRRIFNKQLSIRDKCNYSEKRRTDDIEQLSLSVTEDLSADKETEIKNLSTSLNHHNLSDTSDVSGNASPEVIYEFHSNSEDSQNESLVSIRSTSPIESLTQERYTGCKMGGVRNKASSPDIISETDSEAERSFSLALSFESQRDMFDDEPEHQNEGIEYTFFNQERYADDQDECKSISADSIQSICSSESFVDNDFLFTPILPTSSRHNLIDSFNSPVNQILTQISQMTIFQTDDAMHQKQENADDSQADQMQLSFSNNDNDDVEFQIDDIDMRVENNDTTTKNVEHDNACSTSHIVAFNCDSVLKSLDDQRTPGSNIEHRYKLRNRKKRKTYTLVNCVDSVEEVINSPSTIGSKKTSSISNKRSSPKKQSSLKKHKSEERAKTPSKEKEGSKEEIVSVNWLNFTLDSLNLEEVIPESLKVILSILCDKRMAEEYATHGWWKDTLEEEAVNAVSTLSDIFKMEKKPNICSKEIVTAINKTLNEMMTCVQLNKTSVWNYRVRIILELCDSLSVCVAVIDHLTAKLELLQSTLSKTMMSQPTNQLNFSITINQAHLIFYALNIALRKYRTVVPSGREARSAEDTIQIPHVADLWKARYVDKELEDASLNVDAAEKQWINALRNFKNVAPFATKSISLLDILLL